MIDCLRTLLAAIWDTTTAMAPYLLFGFFMAGVLSVLFRPETVERHLGHHGLWSIIKASAFGVPLPLCSCGVIPVSASLRRHGASRGATTAFLISTPQTGVDSIMVTLSLLGPFFAVFRPFLALATGVIGGQAVHWFAPDTGKPEDTPQACRDACCSTADRPNRIVQIFHYGFGTLARDIAKPLIVGLLIAGLISALVPEKMFAETLGQGILPMLALMLLGIPLYVCATASIPLAAALIAAGFTPGAALAFLMTGPATNAATIATIWKVMGRRTAVVYLGTVVAAAIGGGLFLDYVLRIKPSWGEVPGHWMMPGWIGNGAAVVLLFVLFRSLVRRPGAPSHEEQPGEESVTFRVTGMTCSHCAEAVHDALAELAGVSSVDVNLRSGTATVTGEQLELPQLRCVVEELGYGTEKQIEQAT